MEMAAVILTTKTVNRQPQLAPVSPVSNPMF